jgi:hypothetical protein
MLRMINWKGFRRKRHMALVEVLYRHFSGVPKKRHMKPCSGYPNFRPRFEPSFSRIQIYSVTAILTCWMLLNVNSHYTVFIFKFVFLFGSVGIGTRLRGWKTVGLILGIGNILYYFSTDFWPDLGSMYHSIQWVMGAIYPGIKRESHEANHPLPFSVEDKNCGATPPLPHMVSWHRA